MSSIFMILPEMALTNEVINASNSTSKSQMPTQALNGINYYLVECPTPVPETLISHRWYAPFEIQSKWSNLALTLKASPNQRVTIATMCASMTADLQGAASISIKVPGQFNGGTPPANGRYFKSVTITSNVGAYGSRVHSIAFEDTDRVIAAAMGGLTDQQMQAAGFPNYPTILNLVDTAIAETATLKMGIFIAPSQAIKLTPIKNDLEFIPAGLYFKASFTGAAASVVYMNFEWAGTQSLL